jgi:hypothetical protein
MIDIALILTKKFPGAEWFLDGDAYEGLNWLDNSKKPTEAEIVKHWDEVHYEQVLELTRRSRQNAYGQTADPLFFKFQAGEATKEEWLAARQAVVDANPYPAKSK